MLAWYPYVPIGGEMGTNWAILSYNGKAYFGFSCDVGAVPDPENLEKFVDESFAELLQSAKKMTPTVGTESRSQDAPVPPKPAEKPRRKRSRVIAPGATIAAAGSKPRARKGHVKATTKKVGSKANGAAKAADASKPNGHATLPEAQPAPQPPESVVKKLPSLGTAEKVQAVGA